jgi:3-oxoacyl-[acyl-carrier-protein] synthase-3
LNHARIIGTGGYLPEKVLTNADLEQMIETTADWIVERTGVEERHVAAPGETTCDLAEQASRRALEAAGIEPRDIDLIVLGTTTPDHVFPSVATQLQHRLGCHGGPAFDVQAVCTGFVYAMDIARRFIAPARAAGAGGRGGYLHPHHRLAGSRYLHPVRRRRRRGGAGSGGRTGYHRQPAARRRPLQGVVVGAGRRVQRLRPDSRKRRFRGDARQRSVQGGGHTLKEIAEQILTANNMTVADVDWLIPHQANRRILAATAKRLGLPEERMVDCVRLHGNTSAASVPLALDVAVRDGRIQRGDTYCWKASAAGSPGARCC